MNKLHCHLITLKIQKVFPFTFSVYISLNSTNIFLPYVPFPMFPCVTVRLLPCHEGRFWLTKYFTFYDYREESKVCAFYSGGFFFLPFSLCVRVYIYRRIEYAEYGKKEKHNIDRKWFSNRFQVVGVNMIFVWMCIRHRKREWKKEKNYRIRRYRCSRNIPSNIKTKKAIFISSIER